MGQKCRLSCTETRVRLEHGAVSGHIGNLRSAGATAQLPLLRQPDPSHGPGKECNRSVPTRSEQRLPREGGGSLATLPTWGTSENAVY